MSKALSSEQDRPVTRTVELPADEQELEALWVALAALLEERKWKKNEKKRKKYQKKHERLIWEPEEKNDTMKEGSSWRPREGKYGDVTGGVGSPTVQPIFAQRESTQRARFVHYYNTVKYVQLKPALEEGAFVSSGISAQRRH